MKPNLLTQIPALLQKIAHMASPMARQAWAIYLAQSTVFGLQYVAGAVLWGAGGLAVGLWALPYCVRHHKDELDGFDLGIVFSVVAMIGCAIGFGCCLWVAVPYLANPDYYAIQGLLGR